MSADHVTIKPRLSRIYIQKFSKFKNPNSIGKIIVVLDGDGYQVSVIWKGNEDFYFGTRIDDIKLILQCIKRNNPNLIAQINEDISKFQSAASNQKCRRWCYDYSQSDVLIEKKPIRTKPTDLDPMQIITPNSKSETGDNFTIAWFENPTSVIHPTDLQVRHFENQSCIDCEDRITDLKRRLMKAKPEGINTLNGIYHRAKVVEGQIIKLGESIQIDRSGYIYLSNFIKNPIISTMLEPKCPKQRIQNYFCVDCDFSSETVLELKRHLIKERHFTKLMDPNLVPEDVEDIIKFQGPGCKVNFRELNLFHEHLTEKNCFKELTSKQACQLFKFTKIETITEDNDDDSKAVESDVLALGQSSNSNNELAIQEDNIQSEVIPAICAPVEDNCEMDTCEEVIEAIETNAMKEMRENGVQVSVEPPDKKQKRSES
jgi:hypothetical protein